MVIQLFDVCLRITTILLCFLLSSFRVVDLLIYGLVLDSENKMKNEKYHTVGTIPKSNIKIVERGKYVISEITHYDSNILRVKNTYMIQWFSTCYSNL